MPGRPLSRRGLLGAGLGLAAVVTVGATGTRSASARYAENGLHSQTVAWSAPGERRLVGDASEVLPGTRVLRGATEEASLVATEAAWLAGCAPWTASPLGRSALLDLSVLQVGDVGVAGWSTHWRYTWPRDASHVAMALIRAGRRGEAVHMLHRLQSWQGADGWFEARYRPDGSGSPDARERQLDGVGWVLWAAAGLLPGPGQDVEASAEGVAAELGAGDALVADVRGLRPMIERSVALAIAVTSEGLPRSPPTTGRWASRGGRWGPPHPCSRASRRAPGCSWPSASPRARCAPGAQRRTSRVGSTRCSGRAGTPATKTERIAIRAWPSSCRPTPNGRTRMWWRR